MSNLGVDPGRAGAIARDDAGAVTVIEMPVLFVPGRPGKPKVWEYDDVAIGAFLEANRGSTLWIERPEMFPMVKHRCRTCKNALVCRTCGRLAAPTKNATAAASQASCHTVFKVLCRVHGVAFKIVPAKAWQTVMLNPKKGDDRKALSIAWAQRKYPNVSLLPTARCRKPSHGFSDALAIMEFGARATVVA